MASLLAAAAMFSAGQSPSTGGQNAVRATQGQNKSDAPLPPSVNNQVRNFSLPRFGAVVTSRYGAPIWQGTEKRGNRRTRSRFSYNR
jgi:hypothetical protein